MKIIILIAWYMVRKWDQAIKKNNDKFYLAFFSFIVKNEHNFW